MSNIGRITNALFSANNENTLALANINFDFSLFKFDAPQEFHGVGDSLSMRRKDDAEQGQSHKIARRLGALFQPLVPTTPHLIRAYGTRASEIASVPSVNPKRNSRFGPIADFVGIDGTSLWAAATSAKCSVGAHAPLAMHLLACMLARSWEEDVAVSIWVELVKQRQIEIDRDLDDEPQSIAACMAARQDVSRDDLAAWDASARAWLRSADEAKSVSYIKFNLIAKNISVEVNEGKSTYENVIEAWQHAMSGMEKLIQGIPQDASDGSVLLALSAWHIYPNLIVLGNSTQSVIFDDDLVATGGVLTVGLQHSDASRGSGMHWSLTLSHLRYYGKGIQVDATDDITRVSMDQLLVVVFGSTVSAWEVSESEEIMAANWLMAIWSRFIAEVDSDSPSSHRTKWLQVLVWASQSFLDMKVTNELLCLNLVRWGRRRAKKFLGFDNSDRMPFFGLRNLPRLSAMSAKTGYESAIAYLREIGHSLKKPGTLYIIRYHEERPDSVYFEYMTVEPHVKRSTKRNQDGSFKSDRIHQRWLFLRNLNVPSKSACHCMRPCDDTCFCAVQGSVRCHESCHPGDKRECQGFYPFDLSRRDEIEQIGESCQWISSRDICYLTETDEFLWRNPPLTLHDTQNRLCSAPLSCPTLNEDRTDCSCAKPCLAYVKQGVHEILFTYYYGDPETFSLYRCDFLGDQFIDISSENARSISQTEAKPNLRDAVQSFESINKSSDVLVNYLYEWCNPVTFNQNYLFPSRVQDLRHRVGIQMLLDGSKINERTRDALNALHMAHQIYHHLPGSTFPLALTSKSLSDVKWLPVPDTAIPSMTSNEVRTVLTPQPLSLASSFACIVLFESGMYDISEKDCASVLAIASANSIFIATSLLSDPADLHQDVGQIQRVPGNIGIAGISMLIPPQQKPEIRPLGHNLRVVQHLDYDGVEGDNFAATSLHLRFTKWRRPYNAERRGGIDEGIFYVEAVTSVHDGGKWVADLDVSDLLTCSQLPLHKCVCYQILKVLGPPPVSIDSWEELLDAPEQIGVFRAKGNWAARLAAFLIRRQQGMGDQTMIASRNERACPRCASREFEDGIGCNTGIIID